MSTDEFLDWSALDNPVLEYPDWSIKDFACAHHGGQFHVFFSAFYEDDGRIRSHVVEVVTDDFREYSEPILHFDGREEGWIGMCSPDVSRHDGTYYLTFNSWGDKDGKPNQLFYRTSEDLRSWSERRPLARNLTEGSRAIDAALGRYGDRWYLAWKGGNWQTRIATATDLEGPFEYVGEEGVARFEKQNGDSRRDGHENYQFHEVDGERYLLTTAIFGDHRPTFYRLDGDPERPERWQYWTDGYRFRIDEQPFSTGDRANASAMYDWRDHDGHFYLLYAGNQEGRYMGDTEGPFAGRGWNRLGLARSPDLETWTVPGE